jgi:hypothetical protein
MFFKKKANPNVSFYDFVTRLNASLDESVVAVNESRKENTFENVIRVFRTKTRSTLDLVSGIEVKVDIHGVYTINQFTNERIYLVTFCNGKIVEIPLDESLKSIDVREYVVNLLVSHYSHLLAKLEDQENRLIREQRDVMTKKERLQCLIDPFLPQPTTTKRVTKIVEESKEPETYETE